MTQLNPQLNLAIIGLGRAGQARVRAAATHEGTTVIDTVSRRAGCGSASLDEILANPRINGVIICTENANHEVLVRRALDANKHVLVEYPLSNDYQGARALYEQSRANARVLHVELIGLLTARHRAMKSHLETHGCQRIELTFTGGYYGWVATEAEAGHWGQLALARLHALDDWLGPLSLRKAALNRYQDGYRLEVHLDASGVEVLLVEERALDLKRGRQIVGTIGNGAPLVEPESSEPGRLFGQDLDVFSDLVRGRCNSPYVTEIEVLRNLQLAEAINVAIDPLA